MRDVIAKPNRTENPAILPEHVLLFLIYLLPNHNLESERPVPPASPSRPGRADKYRPALGVPCDKKNSPSFEEILTGASPIMKKPAGRGSLILSSILFLHASRPDGVRAFAVLPLRGGSLKRRHAFFPNDDVRMPTDLKLKRTPNDNDGGKKPSRESRTGESAALSVTVLLCLGVSSLFSFSSPTPTTLSAPTVPENMRYRDAISSQNPSYILAANEKLVDIAVGTINTMYYDNSGGFKFAPLDTLDNFRTLKAIARGDLDWKSVGSGGVPKDALLTRDGTVAGLKWIVSKLDDPYSAYLTREELQEEIHPSSNTDGFLGLGCIVEPPPLPRATASVSPVLTSLPSPLTNPYKNIQYLDERKTNKPSKSPPSNFMSITRADNLPVVTAVVPHSPAERVGIVVGDRIASVGDVRFTSMSRSEVSKILKDTFHAENYAGRADLKIARPLRFERDDDRDGRVSFATSSAESVLPREVLVGYRIIRTRLLTSSMEPFHPYSTQSPSSPEQPALSGGNSICSYELLTPLSSIFDKDLPSPVGYIRLTRFSKASTAGFVDAVRALDALGTQSYIIDVRNNYGGVIQEAMLTASSLLRDPKTVLCYTLNSRGGFSPHDAEEYIVDKRFPGYLLSQESEQITLEDVKRTNPQFFTGEDWMPPSNYAPLHQYRRDNAPLVSSLAALKKQKKVAILMNEGTASAAEVFVSSLHDNGRIVATVGARTYGKGLIQHTFPLPDRGGLRLTVAEYLTPALQHVTKVGGARYDSVTGDLVGGGLYPDVYCHNEGIPDNPGADICVGLALDSLLEDKSIEDNPNDALQRLGGIDGGSGRRNIVSAGLFKDDL